MADLWADLWPAQTQDCRQRTHWTCWLVMNGVVSAPGWGWAGQSAAGSAAAAEKVAAAERSGSADFV